MSKEKTDRLPWLFSFPIINYLKLLNISNHLVKFIIKKRSIPIKNKLKKKPANFLIPESQTDTIFTVYSWKHANFFFSRLHSKVIATICT